MLQLSFANFKKGSYIFVEGTPSSNHFYIIQSGHVQSYHEMNIQDISSKTYGPGDFLGVIPCMSGHFQTETDVALTDVVAIMVPKEQYPELIAKNTPVAMKIVHAFALLMRQMNNILAKISTKAAINENPEQLFNIASHYDKLSFEEQALFVYHQYLKYLPEGKNVSEAKKRHDVLIAKYKVPYLDDTTETIRNYPKQSIIFAENQPGSDMYIIQEGSVKITRIIDDKEITLALLNKGDMFGEMALLDKKNRSATAIAHENCRLMVLNRRNFDHMVQTQPQMIAKLTTMFSERLWSMFRQIENTQLKSVREKMVDMVCIQVEKQNLSNVKGVTYRLDMNAADIANLCGIEPKEQAQAIYLLGTDVCVKVNGQQITIPDVSELIKQSAFYRKQNNRHAND